MQVVQHDESNSSNLFLDHACDRFLSGPLTAIVALVCIAQYVAWVPSYLTWPWWADLDVFGTAALAWERGMLPYRDFLGNNFPFTIYVDWILGKRFGWGYAPSVMGFDALLVGSFGLLLAAWSARVFRSRLPGLIGYGTFLGYYLALDYTQVAQRDWQGPCFAIAAILLIQGWRGRLSSVVSACSMAIALAIRPQTVLYLPGLLVAIVDASRTGESRISAGRAFGRALLWSLAGLAALAGLALPLVRAGILTDFVSSLHVVAPGGKYNLLSFSHFVRQMILQLMPVRIVIVPACLLLMGRMSSVRDGPDPARAWLVAFACVLLYAPLSPQAHLYLAHPLNVTWAILVALLAARIDQNQGLRPAHRLIALLMVMGLLMSFKPRFSDPIQSFDALLALRKGERETVSRPEGYQHNPDVPASARYDWESYRDLLQYVRNELTPEVRVANALRYTPAITGVTGRLPAFPAESIAWLAVVRKTDEDRFVRSLEASANSVVVWAPTEKRNGSILELKALTRAIEKWYEPDRRFGIIEVWKRKPASERAPTPSAR
jgi:hypothetical protein